MPLSSCPTPRTVPRAVGAGASGSQRVVAEASERLDAEEHPAQAARKMARLEVRPSELTGPIRVDPEVVLVAEAPPDGSHEESIERPCPFRPFPSAYVDGSLTR